MGSVFSMQPQIVITYVCSAAAEEMGLGKTLEILGIILSHSAPMHGPDGMLAGEIIPEGSAEDQEVLQPEPEDDQAPELILPVDDAVEAEGDQDEEEGEGDEAGGSGGGGSVGGVEMEEVAGVGGADGVAQQIEETAAAAAAGAAEEAAAGAAAVAAAAEVFGDAASGGAGGAPAAGTATAAAAAAGTALAVSGAVAGVAGANGTGSAGLYYGRATLVVCAVSLVGQWADEAKMKTDGRLRILQYHGQGRARYSAQELARDYDGKMGSTLVLEGLGQNESSYCVCVAFGLAQMRFD